MVKLVATLYKLLKALRLCLSKKRVIRGRDEPSFPTHGNLARRVWALKSSCVAKNSTALPAFPGGLWGHADREEAAMEFDQNF